MTLAALLLAAIAQQPDPAPPPGTGGPAPTGLGGEPPAVEEFPTPGDGAGRFPTLFAAPDGSVHALWTARGGGEAVLRSAAWSNDAWTEVEEIARGADWFVNWADLPQLCVGADGTRLATWLQRTGKGPYDYGVRYVLREPSAESWSAPAWLHRHTGPGEHGFVSVIPEGDGFRAVWLDGRNTEAALEAEATAHGGASPAGPGHHPGGGAMALYTAHIDAEGQVQGERALDERVCDCCSTDLAPLPDEGWAVVFRDRDPEEIRDIGIVSGAEDAAVARIFADEWKIEGCPVNGPVAARSGERFAVAWFTLGADAQPRCQVAVRGADGGFGFPQRFDLGNSAGRVALCGLGDGGFLLSWMETSPGGPLWMTRRLGADGELGPAASIAPAPGDRGAGTLQLAAMPGGALAAWTDVKSRALRFARLRVVPEAIAEQTSDTDS